MSNETSTCKKKRISGACCSARAAVRRYREPDADGSRRFLRAPGGSRGPVACGHVTLIFASVFAWPLPSCLSLGHLSPDPGPTRTIQNNHISRSSTRLPLRRPFSNSGHMPGCQGFGHRRIFWGRLLSTHYEGFYPVQIRIKTLFSSIETLVTPVPVSPMQKEGAQRVRLTAGWGVSVALAGGHVLLPRPPAGTGQESWSGEKKNWARKSLGHAEAPHFFLWWFRCLPDGGSPGGFHLSFLSPWSVCQLSDPGAPTCTGQPDVTLPARL